MAFVDSNQTAPTPSFMAVGLALAGRQDTTCLRMVIQTCQSMLNRDR